MSARWMEQAWKERRHTKLGYGCARSAVPAAACLCVCKVSGASSSSLCVCVFGPGTYVPVAADGDARPSVDPAAHGWRLFRQHMTHGGVSRCTVAAAAHDRNRPLRTPVRCCVRSDGVTEWPWRELGPEEHLGVPSHVPVPNKSERLYFVTV